MKKILLIFLFIIPVVYSSADINNNGLIDASDVSIVKSGFTSFNYNADLNNDGLVNLYDLVIVARDYRKDLENNFLDDFEDSLYDIDDLDNDLDVELDIP